jgi:NAD(P)-dependent dehydrogenase (short-subunit alcohol dehydrogenase family)
MATALVVGGTVGLGRRLAERLVADGDEVVLTGREGGRAESVAAEIGEGASGLGFDLCQPSGIAAALEGLEHVDHVALVAIARDSNTVREYDHEAAIRLATLKVVGFTEVLHVLHSRMPGDSSVVMYGGLAKDRPYPGSATVTAVNGAVTSMVRGFALELAPIRVNAIHPGIVGDSPQWKDAADFLANIKERTPTDRLITMDEVTDAAVFLLKNRSVNGVNLQVDGGWIMN